MAQGKITSINIVSQGQDQYNWFYRIYSNNWVECWRWSETQQVKFTSSGGGAYRTQISFKLPTVVGPIWNILVTPIGNNIIYWNRVVSVFVNRPDLLIVAERNDQITTSVPVQYSLFLIGTLSGT